MQGGGAGTSYGTHKSSRQVCRRLDRVWLSLMSDSWRSCRTAASRTCCHAASNISPRSSAAACTRSTLVRFAVQSNLDEWIWSVPKNPYAYRTTRSSNTISVAHCNSVAQKPMHFSNYTLIAHPFHFSRFDCSCTSYLRTMYIQNSWSVHSLSEKSR